MDSDRLLRLGRAVKQRTAPASKAAAVYLALGWQGLRYRRRIVFWSTGISIVVVLLIGLIIDGGALWYDKHHEAVAPLLTLVAGVAVAGVALARHFAQTDADRQRRITESFSKAVEQLASEKLEVRLGGIYSLERISKESPDDYWTVMENLTAFVRERSRRNERERNSEDLERRIAMRAYFNWLEAGRPDGQAENIWNRSHMLETTYGEPPAGDIDAVLGLITRRSKRNQEREKANNWRFNFRGAVLRRTTQLSDAHLEGAYFSDANLEWVLLDRAHLEGAYFVRAHVENAYFRDAHLEGAVWWGAHLEGAKFEGATGYGLSGYEPREPDDEADEEIDEAEA
jgi:Protein of unknown function (DUF2934)/Pentapeptide repeats (8 copies)